jgi:hypothetical protein
MPQKLSLSMDVLVAQHMCSQVVTS